MTRRFWSLAALGCASAAGLLPLAGCETLGRNALRPKPEQQRPILLLGADDDKEKAKDREPPATAADADLDANGAPRNFFRPNRRSGALSSEAAEIERDLGVR